MIGLTLIATGEFFAEIGRTIGKYEVSQKKESLYAMGFLNSIWVMLFLLLIAYFRDADLVFALQSLPTFIARAVLELTLLFVSLHAMTQADRSTFAFLRILTLPLLLGVDIALGYNITTPQVAGVSIIVVALIFLFLNHGLSKKGKVLTLVSAVLAVGTISLYKYNITNFNSVEAEQITMHLIILTTLIVAARIRTKENLFKTLTNKVLFAQSISAGIASVFMSFAFLFAPASVITTAKRSLEILASMLSGKSYFHEKHLLVKIGAFSLIAVGIILISV